MVEVIPGQVTLDEAIADAGGPKLLTSVTPNGTEIGYSPAPRRFYQVRQPELKVKTQDNGFQPVSREWREVPSVTTILGCLEKPLSWWAQGVGIAAVLELIDRGKLVWVEN